MHTLPSRAAHACPAHTAAPHPESRRWLADCPPEVAPLLDEPVAFDCQEDRGVPALKVHGMDAGGRRCYYRHQYTVRDETLDDEDLPIQVETYREQVTGWRLPDGRWLRHAFRVSGFPGCGRRIERHWSVVATAAELAR